MIVRAGSSPPTSWATATISGSPVIRCKSAESTPACEPNIARLARLAHHDLFQHQRPADMARSPIAMFHQQPGHARADRPHPHNGDLHFVHKAAAWAQNESSILASGTAFWEGGQFA